MQSVRSNLMRMGVVIGLLVSLLGLAAAPASADTSEGVGTNAGAAGRIAASYEHACTVRSTGTIMCWGNNNAGQLGNGTIVASATPMEVLGITNAQSVSVSLSHSCAVLADGTVKCWGAQQYGRLGNGVIGSGSVSTPVTVLGISNAVGISAGQNQTCAVLGDGTISCWGYNAGGQLGDGTTTNTATPVVVAGITTATSVSSGNQHTCAVLADTTARCWGANAAGQLGDGTFTASLAPVAVAGLSGITAISASGLNSSATAGITCAVLVDTTARCWGRNGSLGGELGNGQTSSAYTTAVPVMVTGLTGVTSLSAGEYAACATLTDGTARCWGANNLSQLGKGSSGDSAVPVAVAGIGAAPQLTGALAVTGPFRFTCALHADESVSCWGANDRGNLGQGSTSQVPSSRPVQVGLPSGTAGPTVVADHIRVNLATGDPTNERVTLTLTDADTPLDQLTISAESSNQSILPDAAITVTGSGATRTVSFAPTGSGVITATVIATDPEGNHSSATVGAVVSGQIPDTTGRYYINTSDASTALDVGDGYVLVGDDENNSIRLFAAGTTGYALETWSLPIGSSDEVDIEASARVGNTIVWTASHGNNRSGGVKQERRVIFATTITGSGAATELTYVGRYNNLWAELIAWDQNNGHGLGANALDFFNGSRPGVLPNAPDGFNIEGLEFAADDTTGYLGFRAPTVPVDGEEMAVIVPVTNLLTLVGTDPGVGPAQFGAPILLDLDGRSIREMRRNEAGEYFIIAGPSPSNPIWALYTWDGLPTGDAVLNQELPAENTSATGAWEAIVSVPTSLATGGAARLLADTGDSDLYGTGATKDLANRDDMKSYSQEFQVTAGPEPVVPEAPYAVLLALSGALFAGLWFTVRGRRATA